MNTTALDTLLAELLHGEDPNSPEYPDARARLEGLIDAVTRETAQEPIVVRWDRTVIHPSSTDDDTIVCCLTTDGQPVALLLDDEYREALGLQLVDPEGE